MVLEQTLPYLLYSVAKQSEEHTALLFKEKNDEEYKSWTYKDFLNYSGAFALALSEIGLKRGEHIFFLLDNSKEWAVADLATMALGLVNVPRGIDISDVDLSLFVEHSDSNAIIFHGENEFKRLKELGILDGRILISIEEISSNIKGDVEVYSFYTLINSAMELPGLKDDFLLTEINKGNVNDIISITYTSGTSGTPKGVCLTHKSFTFQMAVVPRRVVLRFQKERILCILPIWHAYQRIIHYLVLYGGSIIAYSKPVGKIMLEDIQKVQPTILPGVPRIFEAIYQGVHKQVNKKKAFSKFLFYFFYFFTNMYYNLLNFSEDKYFHVRKIPMYPKLFFNIFSSIGLFLLYPIQLLGYFLIFRKINKKFGKKLRFIVSGGAHLPLYIDKFLRNIRITVVEGYGMTEMAPLINFRSYPGSIVGSTGKPLDGIDYFLLNDKGKKSSRKGELYVRSPQMMVGYYKNKKITEEVMLDGYLNTGDIVIVGSEGDFKIIGRTKNMVVLANGENIETEPIELILGKFPYISYSVVVGQDEKFLGVLISPDIQELKNYAKDNNISYKNISDLCENKAVQSLYKTFIQENINNVRKFSHTPIVDFVVLDKEFSVNEELTTTLKVKRSYVEKHYFRQIHSLYH